MGYAGNYAGPGWLKVYGDRAGLLRRKGKPTDQVESENGNEFWAMLKIQQILELESLKRSEYKLVERTGDAVTYEFKVSGGYKTPNTAYEKIGRDNIKILTAGYNGETKGCIRVTIKNALLPVFSGMRSPVPHRS